jgi:hypothetical protein
MNQPLQWIGEFSLEEQLTKLRNPESGRFMAHLLQIDASPRGKCSYSHLMTREFIEKSIFTATIPRISCKAFRTLLERFRNTLIDILRT